MSADVLPNARKVTPAMFCDNPSVLEIMNSAGHKLFFRLNERFFWSVVLLFLGLSLSGKKTYKSVAVTPVATKSVSSQRIFSKNLQVSF